MRLFSTLSHFHLREFNRNVRLTIEGDAETDRATRTLGIAY